MSCFSLRKKPDKPQDFGQEIIAIPNLVQEIIIDAPNQVWVSDFTYLPYFRRFIYLSTLEDVFTRQVVGWEVLTRHNAGLVSQALLNALDSHPASKIAYSDQGSEYRSHLYLNLLKDEARGGSDPPLAISVSASNTVDSSTSITAKYY